MCLAFLKTFCLSILIQIIIFSFLQFSCSQQTNDLFSQDNAQHSMQKLVSELFGNMHMETLHLRRLQKCQDKIMNYVILETLCIHQPPVIFLSEKDKEPLHSLKRSHSSLLSLSEVHVSVGKHSHNVLKYVFTLHRNLKTLKTDNTTIHLILQNILFCIKLYFNKF